MLCAIQNVNIATIHIRNEIVIKKSAIFGTSEIADFFIRQKKIKIASFDFVSLSIKKQLLIICGCFFYAIKSQRHIRGPPSFDFENEIKIKGVEYGKVSGA